MLNKVILKEDLHDLYITQKLPMSKIAERYGVSPATILHRCRRYNIPTRAQRDTFTFKGLTHEKSAKDAISHAHKGRVMSAETRRKLSESRKDGGIGHKKKRSDGYVAIYFPDHPRSTKAGYIQEHILVMECLLGRHLNKGEVVHHINGKKDDNRKENLELMTVSEHMRLHMNLRREQKNA